MKAKVGYSPLASTSLGSDCQSEGCLHISGGDHLVSLANRHFNEGNTDEACRLLREALRGVSTYLAETEEKAGKKADLDYSGAAVGELKPA
jgi:hypothetical protein